MKIGVIADTHNRLEITEQALGCLAERGAEALFHCGDLMNEEILELCSRIKPCYFVAGNNDPSDRMLKKWAQQYGLVFLGGGGIVDLGRWRVGISHGHHKASIQKILVDKPDYLLVGHSHFRKDEWVGSTRVINPGALHRSSSKSCAFIDLEGAKVEIILLPAAKGEAIP